jgi:hypothetical protein
LGIKQTETMNQSKEYASAAAVQAALTQIVKICVEGGITEESLQRTLLTKEGCDMWLDLAVKIQTAWDANGAPSFSENNAENA